MSKVTRFVLFTDKICALLVSTDFSYNEIKIIAQSVLLRFYKLGLDQRKFFTVSRLATQIAWRPLQPSFSKTL